MIEEHLTDPLLGTKHRDCLDRLLALFDALDVSGPRMALIVGPSGAGKTRVVQEFYRRLSAAQPSPPYWPSTLVESAVGDREPLLARKVVAPDPGAFEWPAGALPTFTWWGFACERLRDGSLRDSSEDVHSQFQAHSVATEMALARTTAGGKPLAAQIPALRRRAQEALQEGGLEVAGALLAGAGLPVPGLGLLVKWIGHSASTATVRRDQLHRLRTAVDVGAEIRAASQEQGRALGEILIKLSSSEVPAVVVIEDLHQAPPELLDTLDTILGSASAKVLVVANAWPESLHESGVAGRMPTWDAAGRLERHHLSGLDFQDLSALAARFAPNTDRFGIEWLVETHPNPLALSLFLTLPSVRAQLEAASGAFKAPTGATRVPRGISDLYRSRWLELPQITRQTLAFAHVVGCSKPDSTGAFLPSTVVDAARGAGLLDADRAAAVLHSFWEASAELGWLRRQPERWTFAEIALRDAAGEGVDETLAADTIDRLRDAVRGRLQGSVAWTLDEMSRRWAGQDVEPPSRVFLSDPRHVNDVEALLELTDEGAWASQSMCVPVLTRIAQAAANQNPVEALRLLHLHDPLRHIPENWSLRLELEREVSEWFIETDDLQSALAVMESVVARREASGSRGVDASQLYADLLGLTGRPEEAWQEYEWMAEWMDYDIRVEGLCWLLEARGHAEAWTFLMTLLEQAESGAAEDWIGVECARLMRSRSLRLGDDQLAVSLLIRAIRLSGDSIEEDLVEAYSALPPEQREPGIERKLALSKPRRGSGNTYESTPALPESGPLYDLWNLDQLDEEGRYDEAVPTAERMLAEMPEGQRGGRTHIALRLWMAHLYLKVGQSADAARVLLGLLMENRGPKGPVDIAIQIREHAYLTHGFWGEGERKEQHLRLSALLRNAASALDGRPESAALLRQLREGGGVLLE